MVIHDGVANSGHYYCYIYDRVEGQWWCYNDHETTKVSEELVMREAVGGVRGSHKSAYNLIYVS